MHRSFHIRPLMAVFALVLASIGGGIVAGYMNGARPSPLQATVSADSLAHPGSGELVTFAPIVKLATPAVVNISTTTVVKAQRGQRGQGGNNPLFNDPFFRQFFGGNMGPESQPRDHRAQALGSGVIVKSDGYILTNNHVVDGATDVKVYLADKREFKAKVIGTDKQTDIAVLKIDATNLPVLHMSTAAKPAVGDVCLAIGDPFGLGQTVTMGIVSATGRAGLGIEEYEDFIQTDASINPGNSGGALINTRGEMIGINTAILSGNGGGNQGIGFAIPVSLASNVMNQIEEHGKVSRGYMGATVQQVSPSLAKAFGLSANTGVALTQIEPGSPSAKAGLKSGDVVVELNGQPVTDVDAFRLQIAELGPGATAHMKLYRDGHSMDATVSLAQRPTDEALAKNGGGGNGPGNGAKSALEGVSVETVTPDDAQQLGLGPSAKGVVVTDVDQSSAAAEAGLQRGDVILQVNHQAVATAAEFENDVRQSNGKGTLLLVNRGGGTLFIAIESK
ncbi:MAG: DegQ family serine endoprotease [Bryobacteraceae bacterium]